MSSNSSNVQNIEAASLLGTVIGLLGGLSRSRMEAISEADQAGLNRATLSGFQQVRYQTQKKLWSRSLITGAKCGFIAGLFTAIDIGLYHKRGYWDAWNPLLAGTFAGGFYGLHAGFRGAQLGCLIGGILAIPITGIQMYMRLYISDDSLMPATTILSDPSDSKVKFELKSELDRLDELEKGLELDKPYSERSTENKALS